MAGWLSPANLSHAPGYDALRGTSLLLMRPLFLRHPFVMVLRRLNRAEFGS